MKNLLLSIVMIAFLSGCDMNFKVETEEESSEKEKIIDVYCSPTRITEDGPRGLDLIITESDEFIAYVREYVLGKKVNGQTYWFPKWRDKVLEGKVVRGKNRIFLRPEGTKIIMRRTTPDELTSLQKDNGLDWFLYLPDDPDRATYHCYGSRHLTQDLYPYLYNSRPVLDLKIRP